MCIKGNKRFNLVSYKDSTQFPLKGKFERMDG